MRSLAQVTLLVIFTTTANACGGFFCSQSAPVDQAAEQIIFAIDGNKVTAHIRIQYSGPSEQFSWILPLPTPPELAVGTETFFTSLQQRTRPMFSLDETNGKSPDGEDCGQAPIMMTARAEADTAAGSADGVEVLETGTVGPFNFVLLLATDGNATKVVNWLNDNDYDQPAGTADLLQSYAEYNFTFLALRMAKDSNTGDIQPLVVKYEFKQGLEALSCIPLKLTKVAAVENMPLYVWVLSNKRAVPVNYLEVHPDWSQYDWMNCARFGCVPCDQHYLDFITRMVDVPDGHGFVTEYAGSSQEVMKDWFPTSRFNASQLTAEEDPVKYLRMMLQQGVPNRDPLAQAVIRKWIPKPSEDALPDGCKTDQEFYSWNTEKCFQEMPESWKFESASMTADLQKRIITPLQEANALLAQHNYMTRLISTISPVEMTSDPLFTFDGTLADVPREKRATAQITCPVDKDTINVQFAFDDTTWQVSGAYQGCEFRYNPPLPGSNPSNVTTPNVRLFKRTGDPATSGAVPLTASVITATLAEMEKTAMDLMPDNAWTEIPDNSAFKDQGASDDDGGDDDTQTKTRSKDRIITNTAAKVVLSTVLFVFTVIVHAMW